MDFRIARPARDRYGFDESLFSSDGDAIVFEVTEQLAIRFIEDASHIMEALMGVGCRFALDDFGTGHSSLAYLKRLPVHTLKVDKSFVTDMDADEDNASIVLATIDLAHSLGLAVTAEGVETRPVFEMLWEMGCDCYQGYYVSEPLELKAISGWLDSDHMARQAN